MTSTDLSLCVAGASGRMGHMLIETILQTPGCRLSGALDRPDSPALGLDAGAFLGRVTGVPIVADLTQGLAGARCLIDFTRPEGTLAHLQVCRALGVQMVIGTTGFSAAQKEQIAAAAQDLAIVLAPNMSVGVNVTLKLLALAARSLDASYDVEVLEMHHKRKVDAPSGTALKMGEVIAQARGQRLADCAVYAREGHTGERAAGSIGFATLRGGDVVGDHTVIFAAEGERIEISHKSASRASYAQGSVRAARFLASRQTGLYDMDAVLGL